MSNDLQSDLYIIPVEDGMSIIYAPLHGAAFYANENAATLCRSYINGETKTETEENACVFRNISSLEKRKAVKPRVQPINTTSSLVVILSQMCNLACSYCFAQESRSKEVLDKEKLKVAIDYIFAQKSKNKRFSFIGGGEPTVTWDLLAWAISYIRSQETSEKQCHIGITTNGTLFNKERIDFIQDNKINLNLSFEILPEIQSTQRCYANPDKKSFDTINELIHQLMDRNIPFSFRSTITVLNVSKMPEMVEFVRENYPIVKRLHFEPVTSTNNSKEFYDEYIHYFMEAFEIGQHYNIDVYCSVSNGIKYIKNRFCRGEMCLTPTGDFVGCHRISSKEDSSFDLFNFAHVDNIDNRIIIDDIKKKNIEDFYNAKRDACATCFARWHCAGSCAMERTVYTEEMRDLKCYFFRTLVTQLLRAKLGNF